MLDHVLPNLAKYNITDITLRCVEAKSNLVLGESVLEQGTDCSDVIFSKDSVPMSLPTWDQFWILGGEVVFSVGEKFGMNMEWVAVAGAITPPFLHFGVVLRCCRWMQMVATTTQTIITRMGDVQAFRDWTDLDDVSNTVGQSDLLTVPEASIATDRCGASPRPASFNVGLIDFLPQAVLNRDFGIGMVANATTVLLGRRTFRDWIATWAYGRVRMHLNLPSRFGATPQGVISIAAALTSPMLSNGMVFVQKAVPFGL